MEKQRKIIIVSLAANLMAVILYVFGITLAKGNIIIEALYFIMASLLVVSAVISLFNNYKKYKKALYIYWKFDHLNAVQNGVFFFDK